MKQRELNKYPSIKLLDDIREQCKVNGYKYTNQLNNALLTLRRRVEEDLSELEYQIKKVEKENERT